MWSRIVVSFAALTLAPRALTLPDPELPIVDLAYERHQASYINAS